MGFFKKLKERLFKSSSKIDEGLDAIIEDGGEAEEVELEEDLKIEKESHFGVRGPLFSEYVSRLLHHNSSKMSTEQLKASFPVRNNANLDCRQQKQQQQQQQQQPYS